MMQPPLFHLTDIFFHTHERPILEGVGLTIRAGEFVTLIGPNGAGKTTLLKLVIGLIKPSSGALWRKDGLKIGYMPQKLSIDRSLPLTVGRFLSLYHAKEPRLRSLLAEVGMERLYDTDLSVLSGGEFQRVLLVRALLCHPDILILDEPVQGVDILGQNDLYRLIGRYRERNSCAVLLVSHDLHLVLSNSDRVICLNGHVCCEGTPDKIQQTQEYKTMFGDLRQLTTYTHHHDHTHDHSSCEMIVQDEERGL